MKKVEILVRRLPWKNKMLGKGGQYDVTDIEAKQLVRDGNAKVVADLGTDQAQFSDSERGERQKFLDNVYEHRNEIFSIIEQVFQERSNADELNVKIQEDENLSKENAENSKAGNASSNESGTDQGETSDDSDDNGDNAKGSEDETDVDDSSTLVPDGFPSKDKLEEAGFKTIESIPRDPKVLEEAGLSARSINAIAVRLKDIDGE